MLSHYCFHRNHTRVFIITSIINFWLEMWWKMCLYFLVRDQTKIHKKEASCLNINLQKDNLKLKHIFVYYTVQRLNETKSALRCMRCIWQLIKIKHKKKINISSQNGVLSWKLYYTTSFKGQITLETSLCFFFNVIFKNYTTIKCIPDEDKN